MILLKDIAPAAENNIETKFILLEKGRVIVEGQYKTCLALVADETAAVHFQLWGDECDAFEAGDIVDLTNGIFSTQRNNLVLRAGKRGKVKRIGEFTMSFVETPNMSEIHWIPDPTSSKKYIQGHVISPYSRVHHLTSGIGLWHEKLNRLPLNIIRFFLIVSIQRNTILMVFDHMPNGSLDVNLLDWKIRYQIALGTARELTYLHEKCRECIIHCDVKPSNTLQIDSWVYLLEPINARLLLGFSFDWNQTNP